ncbi:Rv3235 family protein [Kineococcus sp. SYSU DK003]|uniref:Rv3235 family protein n=1 Tax=Kineococcus sp. SYSU DK003 TaxID=3383124 RepID=UPI003D7D9EDA
MTINAVAVEQYRLSPLPYGLPPYVDEEDAFGPELAGRTHLSPDQGVLDLELVDPRMRPPAELPEVTAWTTRYLVTLLEVFTGQRPTQQLLRWSTADIYAAVQRRAALQARLRARTGGQVRAARVKSLRVSFPCEGVAEVGGVLRDTDRFRAVALRVERCTDRSGERWRVTALELG